MRRVALLCAVAVATVILAAPALAGAASTPAPALTPTSGQVRIFSTPPVLRPGTTQLSVLTLKNALQAISDPVAMPWARDPRYTAPTVTKVTNLQRFFGLPANGVVDARTWKLLFTLADNRIAAHTHARGNGPTIAYLLGGSDGGITVGVACAVGVRSVQIVDFTARNDALRFFGARCTNGEAQVRIDANPNRAPGLHTFHASGTRADGSVTHLTFLTAGF